MVFVYTLAFSFHRIFHFLLISTETKKAKSAGKKIDCLSGFKKTKSSKKKKKEKRNADEHKQQRYPFFTKKQDISTQ